MAGVSLLDSVVLATSGAGPTVPGFGDKTTLRVQLNVTAAAGVTPTLDVRIEDTIDGTNWNTVATFAQKVAVGREVLNITTPFADRLRVSSTIAGTTPSFTFSVLGYIE